MTSDKHWTRSTALASLAGSAGVLALLAGLFILEAGIGLAGEAPRRSEPASLPASQSGVEALVGAPADRCVYASPGRRLCRWQLEGRLIRPIARGGIGDGQNVRIICTLPLRADEAGACVAHPNGESRLPAVAAASSPGDPFVSLVDIGGLSHALGDIPERCRTRGGAQICSWPISPRAYGLEGFAPDAEDVRLRCLLPLDGSPRADGSCEVVAPD